MSPDEVAVPAGDTPAGGGPGRALVLGLAVLVLVLGALVGRVLMLQHSDRAQVDEVVTVVDVADGSERAEWAEREVDAMVVAGEGISRAGSSAAAAATEKVLSYSWRTLDEDMRAAQAQLAQLSREEYVATMGRLRERTERDRVTVRATVASGSVVSATAHDVLALLFVDRETSGRHLSTPRRDQSRVLVSLHRDSGGWTVTRLTAL